MKVENIVSWNRCWYGIRKNKKTLKYYKSHNVSFDNTCGGTEEIMEDEYYKAAKKYAEVFKD